MKNIKMEKKGDNLIITINTKESHGKSSSGKTTIVATTAGNVEVDGVPGLYLGLNAYMKP